MIELIKAFDKTLEEDFGKGKNMIYALMVLVVVLIPLSITLKFSKNIIIEITYLIGFFIFLCLFLNGIYHMLKDDLKEFIERVKKKIK